MKIRTRLSVTFSLISSTIFIAFGVTLYFLTSNYRKQDFQDRLKERVVITQEVFLEKESFSTVELEKIKNEFLHTLPEETEEVLLIQKGKVPKFKHEYPLEIRHKLAANETFEFEYLDLQGESRTFQVNDEDFLIIVTAVDTVGLENLSFLKKMIILLILLGIPVTLIGSLVITTRAMLPISRKIAHANAISAFNLHERLKVYNSKDEIGKLAVAFNRLLDRLEASFEAQKSFIRNASHEIKNPLTAIMGEAEIAISKTRTTAEYVKSLSTIITEAEALNSSVNNLLNLSKVAANEGNIKREIIQFDEFLQEIKVSFSFLNPKNQVSLTVADKKGMGVYSILGNKNLLKTAVINLLDNACKFSSNGKVDVALTYSDLWVELTIRDKGIGIALKDIEKISTPFYRGNNALKIKGSGIGLALSFKIIDLHQGKLEVQSKIEIGTEVHVKLPILSI